MTSRANREFGQLFQSYMVNILLFSCAITLYRTNPYYKDFLAPNTQKMLLAFLGIYIVAAIPLELLLHRERRRLEGKGFIVLCAVLRFLRDGWRYLVRFPLDRSRPPALSHREKTSVLFLLVKFFYLPLMINFLFGNWGNMMSNWTLFSSIEDMHKLMLDAVFPFLYALFLFVDTAFFIFGYSVEYPAARNEVRSVEPTLFGWMVALLCYPPFNNITSNYLLWTADSKAGFESSLAATYVLRIVELALLWGYLWPTLALGPRSSNLTNRGIVTWGPYAYVRHPAYVCKLAGWWVISIPFFLHSDRFLAGVLSLVGWTTIYFFRALTEERHLIADPDYQEYCKKVRWRFIPHVL